MRMKLPFLVATLLGAAACSKDSSSLPTTSPTTSNGFNVVADSGVSGRTVTVHSTIPVTVHVTQNSTAAAGQTVTWSVGTTNGSVSAATSTTDANGAASVNWTVGDTARVYTLVASLTGTSTNITATAVGGAVAALAKVSADSSAVVAGGALTLVARAGDKLGNGTPGIIVNWTATGGTLTAAPTTTGNSGNASVNFVTTAPGTYFVTATVAGVGSVTFKVVAL